RLRCIDLLVTAAGTPDGPLLVILTLRADFYDRPLRYPGLGALIHAHSVVTLPPMVADLRRAIEGPAALPDVQLSFDDDLVGDLLFDLRGQSGALPLLQFTLDQLFARRDGTRLTGAAYRALGGVRGALARHAEAAYAALPTEDHRRLARALFLRLIDPGVTERDTTRRRADLTEFTASDPGQSARLREVIDAFVTARLLVVSRGEATGSDAPRTTIEVSHEALIREWARLGEWLRAAREDVHLQQTLSADAAEWERHGRQADHLYRGSVLDEAQAWAERNTPSALETDFVRAALGERQRQGEEERTRQGRELAMARRASTRLRLLVGVLALFLVGAAGLTAFALANAHQADVARQQSLSRQLAAQAVTRLATQYDLALLLSLEARDMASTVEARAALLQGLEAAPPGLIGFLRGQTLGLNSVTMSRDGKLLASGSEDGTIGLWDMRRRRALGPPLPVHAGPIWGVAFSPNGKVLASGDDDGTVRLWDTSTQRSLGPPVRAHAGPSTPLAFSPDGAMLASAGDDGRIAVWAVTPLGALVRPTSVAGCGIGAQSWALAISANGKELANGCTDGTIALWRVVGTTLTSIGALNAGDTVFGVAFSPDGKTLASAGYDHTIRLWDAAGQRQIGAPLTGHTDTVFSVAFSPDGKTLASGSLDGTARLWDVRSRRPLGSPLAAHTGDVNSVVFSPDGRTLATGTANGSVALWDVQHPQTLTSTLNLGQTNGITVSPDGKTVASVNGGGVLLWDVTGGTPRLRSSIPVGDATAGSLSPDGRTVAVGEQIGSLQLWDAANGSPLGVAVMPRGGSVDQITFSPNGTIVAMGSQDGTIQLWSAATRPRSALRPLGSVMAGHSAVQALAFSPNGTILASGGADRLIRLWDVTTRRPLGPPLAGHVAGVNDVAFSPNGTILASAGSDRTVRLWDVTRRRALGPPLIGHTDDVGSVAFSPDGTLLASGSSDHTVRLWDVASGQPLGAPLSTGHTGYVAGVAFTPDGRTLVAANTDGDVVRWTIDLPAWPRRACQIANRNLTQQEWRQYLGNLPYQKTCADLPAGS
ncbi:MAG TPA: WD40 repeat domain-containing protein, partial [Chloroflexota bacterium]